VLAEFKALTFSKNVKLAASSPVFFDGFPPKTQTHEKPSNRTVFATLVFFTKHGNIKRIQREVSLFYAAKTGLFNPKTEHRALEMKKVPGHIPSGPMLPIMAGIQGFTVGNRNKEIAPLADQASKLVDTGPQVPYMLQNMP
jgi:hypothetical protein